MNDKIENKAGYSKNDFLSFPFLGWFWMDHETLNNILNDSNFSSHQDVSPKRCRDAIIHLRK